MRRFMYSAIDQDIGHAKAPAQMGDITQDTADGANIKKQHGDTAASISS